MIESARPRPLVLCILDGLGERAESKGNAVLPARTPNLDTLAQRARARLAASGPSVGLGEGVAGSGEIGHLQIGTGRVVPASSSPVDAAIADQKLRANPAIDRIFGYAFYNQARIHLFALLSSTGVHSSLAHLYTLIDAASFENLPVVVHAFLDGRDAPTASAQEHLEQLETYLEKKGVIGTIAGRAYAMDRAGRWDRTRLAYEAIVRGDAPQAQSVFEALQDAYGRGQSAEALVPTRIGEYEGLKGDYMADFAASSPIWQWLGEEVGIAVNFRADRMRQLTAMLTRRNLPEEMLEYLTERKKTVTAFPEESLLCMTEYDPVLSLPVAFPGEQIPGSLGEVVSREGLSQLRCAETEKAPHVTFFFNGRRNEPFERESRVIVPSASEVESWADRPAMSAMSVAAEVVKAVEEGEYDFIVVNFANPDVVGHTGKLEATIKAVEAVDEGLGAIVRALESAKGAIVVTASHGNCEQMTNELGKPHTAHTTNPVPFYFADFGGTTRSLRSEGVLADVAPTVLELLGLPKPATMTGATLLLPLS